MFFGTIFKLLVLSSIIPTAAEHSKTATKHPESYQVGLNVQELAQKNLPSSVATLTEYRAILQSMNDKDFLLTGLQLWHQHKILAAHQNALNEKYQILKAYNHPHTNAVQQQIIDQELELRLLLSSFRAIADAGFDLSPKEIKDLKNTIQSLGEIHKNYLQERNYLERFSQHTFDIHPNQTTQRDSRTRSA